MTSDLPDANAPDFWDPRRCLREPIPEIFLSAQLLDNAADAALSGHLDAAACAIREADDPKIREWIESLWGSSRDNPNQHLYRRLRKVDFKFEPAPVAKRSQKRMPTADEKKEILRRFGWNCAYCGIPLIHSAARSRLRELVPDVIRWGSTNRLKHNALQCMTPEWDHVLPHSRGGTSDVENTFICCGPCNCGKENRLLAMHGLIDPRDDPRPKSHWDGLTKLVTGFVTVARNIETRGN